MWLDETKTYLLKTFRSDGSKSVKITAELFIRQAIELYEVWVINTHTESLQVSDCIHLYVIGFEKSIRFFIFHYIKYCMTQNCYSLLLFLPVI